MPQSRCNTFNAVRSAVRMPCAGPARRISTVPVLNRLAILHQDVQGQARVVAVEDISREFDPRDRHRLARVHQEPAGLAGFDHELHRQVAVADIFGQPRINKTARGEAVVHGETPMAVGRLSGRVGLCQICAPGDASGTVIARGIRMTDFWRLTATDIAARIRSREFSAREAALDGLARLQAVNPAINAVIDYRPETTLAQAAAVDAQIARGEDPGVLAGVPVTVKVKHRPGRLRHHQRRHADAGCFGRGE